MSQKVETLTQTIEAQDATRPLFIRTAQPRVASNYLQAGGSTESGPHVEEYVALSALPQDLRERVVTAIQALLRG